MKEIYRDENHIIYIKYDADDIWLLIHKIQDGLELKPNGYIVGGNAILLKEGKPK